MNEPGDQRLESLRVNLDSAYKSDPQRHLKLDAASLGKEGAGMIALFQQKLGTPAIELTEQIQIPTRIENQTLVVSGKMAGLSVTATFQTEEDAMAVRVLIRADQKDFLKKPFPKLDDQLFAQLDLSSDGNGNQIAAVAVPGLGKKLAIANPKFAVVAVSTPNEGDAWFDLIPRVDGRLLLGAASLPISVGMPTEMTGWTLAQAEGERWTFQHLLEQFLPGLPISGLLPSPLDNLQTLSLNWFTLYLNPKFSANNALALSIGKTDAHGAAPLWQIAPGIQLDDVVASFSLNLNEQTQALELSGAGWVEGDFRFGESLVGIHIPIPISDGAISVGAYPNLSLANLTDLAALVSQGAAAPEQLMPPDLVKHLADVRWTYLSLDVEMVSSQPRFQSASFALELVNSWPILEADRLTLNGIRLQIEITSPTTKLAVAGAIAASFKIGEADVHVSLHRYDPAKEWELSVISRAIPLPSLGDLARLFGPNVDVGTLLPPSLAKKRFVLDTLALDLKLGASSPLSRIALSLGLEAGDAWDFAPSPIVLEEFTAALQLDWASGKPVPGGKISGSMLIGKTRVRVLAERPASADAGWVFEGGSKFLPIGDLILYLSEKFNITDLPGALHDFILNEVSIKFDTSRKDVHFVCIAQIPLGQDGTGGGANGNSETVEIHIDLVHSGKATDRNDAYEAGLRLVIGELDFELKRAQGQQTETMIATYKEAANRKPLQLRALLGKVSSEIASLFPEDFTLDLKDALFVYGKKEKEKKFFFGLDIGAAISLSDLPLVGKEFPPERKLGIEDLQVLIASAPFNAEEVKTLNDLLPPGVTRLPDVSKNAAAREGEQAGAGAIALKKGLNVGAKLKLGDTTRALAFPATASDSPGAGASSAQVPAATQAAAATDNATWVKVQKSLGPVNFERVGVQYKDAKVWFLLDAALTAAGLTLSLSGLSVGSSISKFEPQFDLRGLGIDYRNDALEIGGAFLKVADKEYAGAAVLKARQLTLSALGMYKEMADGHPSVFVYAVLDYPLGGPSFFFVTGLAAGFGYSRALKIPTIDRVASFSLVENARKGAGMPKDIGAELQKLANDITPAAGENFLAIGVKFTSFKIVDSFALLTVSFGSHFELNLLGLSNLVAPPNAGAGVPPVAEVQLALKASFQPDKGFLGVQAQLTPNSYLLSKACHLTGGFAFFSWFGDNEHAGDFVLTLGGYHPHFRVPAHYPTVPRLGFNWQVSPELSLKGDAYFALTASALMAGGHFEANWLSDSVHAWFKLGADFLIAWKPYHYEIAVYVDMGVEVTFEFFGTHHITVDVGADLSLWGPEFSGVATIHLWIISFTVEFGAAASHTPPPIDWPAFKSSFLPADKDVCGIAVTGGLIGKDSQDASDLGIINPKHFSLATNSVVPSTAAQYALKDARRTITFGQSPGRFGIGSMAVAPADLTSTQTITIKREGDFASEDFEYTPIFKNVPAGLWGESLTPEVNGKQFVENALSGFEIHPKAKSRPGETAVIERRKLQEDGFNDAGEYRWESVKPFAAAPFDSEQKRRDELRKSLAAGAAGRNAILAALGFTPDDLGKIALGAVQADDFLIAPQIEK